MYPSCDAGNTSCRDVATIPASWGNRETSASTAVRTKTPQRWIRPPLPTLCLSHSSTNNHVVKGCASINGRMAGVAYIAASTVESSQCCTLVSCWLSSSVWATGYSPTLARRIRSLHTCSAKCSSKLQGCGKSISAVEIRCKHRKRFKRNREVQQVNGTCHSSP